MPRLLFKLLDSSNEEFHTIVPITYGIDGLSVGYDFGEAVAHEYQTPFRFTGELKQTTVDLSGDLIQDDEATVRQLMSMQ